MADVKGRAPRLSEQETRRRLIDLAVQTLSENGLGVGLDAIGFERLIAQAGVSRASAYRIWPSRADFLAEALVATVRSTTLLPETPEDVARLLAIVGEYPERLADSQRRRDVVVEGLRVSFDADVRRMVASPRWRLYLTLSLTAPTIEDDAVRVAVLDALDAMEREFVERRAEVFTPVVAMLGYRPTSPTGLRRLAEQAGIVARGVVTRAISDPASLDERTEQRLFGSSQTRPWSAAEELLVGTWLAHIEPDPDVVWDEARVEASLAQFHALAATLADPAVPTSAGN